MVCFLRRLSVEPVTRFVPLMLLAAACASDARVEGALRESHAGTLAVRWGPAGSGLLHGQGEAAGERYWLAVDGEPPPAAFHQGVAVAEIVLSGPGTSVRLGAPLDDVRGVAEGVALIHREGELGEDAAWASAFPEGISCAARDDQGWTPVECAALEPLSFD